MRFCGLRSYKAQQLSALRLSKSAQENQSMFSFGKTVELRVFKVFLPWLYISL
jgi:hypothetical protein